MTDAVDNIHVRPAEDRDILDLTAIYNHYIDHSVATFEETPITEEAMAQRVLKVTQLGLPYLVAESANGVEGFAYAGTWKERVAYRHTVEVTVYLHPRGCGRGVGSQLYEALFAALATLPIHVAVSCITLPNPASAALHEKFGMRQVGTFPAVGYKHGRWLDVGYWHRELESSTESTV